MRSITTFIMLFAGYFLFSPDLMAESCNNCQTQYNMCMAQLKGKKKCTRLKNNCLNRCSNHTAKPRPRPKPVYRPQPQPKPVYHHNRSESCHNCQTQYNTCMAQLRGKKKCKRRFNNCKRTCHGSYHAQPKPRPRPMPNPTGHCANCNTKYNVCMSQLKGKVTCKRLLKRCRRNCNGYVQPQPQYPNCTSCQTKFNICMAQLNGRAECNRRLRNCNPGCYNTIQYDPTSCINSCRNSKNTGRANCLYTFEQTPCPRKGKQRTHCIDRLQRELNSCYQSVNSRNCHNECRR